MPKREQSIQRLAVLETSYIIKMHCARTDVPPNMQGGAPLERAVAPHNNLDASVEGSCMAVATSPIDALPH
jgi:hypothetical protein